MNIFSYPTATEVVDELAFFLQKKMQKAINEKGSCSIALAGGNTPKALYKKLANSAIATTIDWSKVFFFWGDERYVPNTHADSNEKMAREYLLNHIPVPADNIFPIPTHSTPANDADAYNETLIHFFGDNGGFDLILLGLGSDGHTLSLFPNTSILQEYNLQAAMVWVPQLHTYRISLTYACALKAACLVFLVTGTDKKDIIQQILDSNGLAVTFPAEQLVKENKERVTWFIQQ